ncbi:RhaT family transporter [Pseudaestuariivita atlantica]|uniref:RhaT family transporter n=2 Tax=Pseudaestuariivita atlantica TaxID=1317121 RepID=A0A0L1JTH3_9RHOB|nr:RhaT family transporter [Pseudaestuariivita atlantica]
MVLTSLVFAFQDGISRHLAETYNTPMVVTIRYWFFAAFVVALSARHAGGLARVIRARRPGIQILRGLILAVEINVMVFAFTKLGLVEAHAIFAAYPLLVAALSGPVLGEFVGWRRWLAIAAGFAGMLVILQPGSGVFSPWSLIPVVSATLFALYNLLTRLANRTDSAATAFFYTGTVGALAMTPLGLWLWEPMAASDWVWMGALCLTGAGGHWLLIKALDLAEASVLQPFAYLQMVFGACVGLLAFNENLRPALVAGAVIIVAAGLFTWWRERRSA